MTISSSLDSSIRGESSTPVTSRGGGFLASRPDIEMEERLAPSRPTRLGTQRRAPRQGARHLTSQGASRSSERRAPSLDTGKQLATTVRDMLKASVTAQDKYHEKVRIHKTLSDSIHRIWQRKALQANAALYLAKTEDELKAATALAVDGEKWEKQYLRLAQCQAEWIGYSAQCCKDKTRPVAVPIGCNHRLCPLCAWHRAENSRKRVRKMFDRLIHPALITLTIPNRTTIRKHDFTNFRQKVRKFIKQHAGWIKGGVYSLETTYNRQQKTWHIHVHILADLDEPLPTKADKVTVLGKSMYAFTLRKMSLEYDWLRLWTADYGKKVRKDANPQAKAGDAYNFQTWMEAARANAAKEWRNGSYQLKDLPAFELAKRTAWNAKNRRVIDLKPVTDREGAAFEVLKYITKSSSFADLPEAIEPFMNAVRGARLIQTFGTWYGVQLEADVNEHDWSEMKCACGCNEWQRMGVFYRHEVQMNVDGRWHLRDSIKWDAAGRGSPDYS